MGPPPYKEGDRVYYRPLEGSKFRQRTPRKLEIDRFFAKQIPNQLVSFIASLQSLYVWALSV